MLAKIISALALTLLLAGGALPYAPQPHNVIYTGHSSSVQLQAQLFAAEPHNVYAGLSNSVQPQESLQTQLFAEDTTLSETRQFD